MQELLNIDNIYFDGIINQNNTSSFHTDAPFLDLRIISNRFISSKIFDKRDDFDIDIVNVLHLDRVIHIRRLILAKRPCYLPNSIS